jgi:hypothetical protein
MTAVLIAVKNFIPMGGYGRIKSIGICLIYALIGGLIYFGITYKAKLYDNIIGFKLRRKK